MRFEKEINIYSDEAIIKRFKANETSVNVVQGKISALISESELVELQNSKATMYSKLASAVMDIKSLTLNFSDLTTKYNAVSGQYTALDSKVAQYKAGVDGLSANVSSVQTDVTSLKTWQESTDLKISDSAIVATVTSSSSYKDSVSSLIEQKANSIRLKADRISWKSTYSSMTEYGTLTCENATIKGTLYSENGKDKVYLRNGRMQIFYNGQELGLIGGNGMNGYPNIEGLNFDLENTGDYMAWASQTSSGSLYSIKMIYTRNAFAHYLANHINFDCDINLADCDIVVNASGAARIVPYVSGMGLRTKDYITIENASKDHIAWFDNKSIILEKPVYANIAGTPSDERVKMNIAKSNMHVLDVFNEMKFRSFDWIESGEHEGIGLIAQELEKMDPALVRECHEMKYIDTTRLLLYCAKAIQELIEANNAHYIRLASEDTSYDSSMTLEKKKVWIKQITEKYKPQKNIQNKVIFHK